MDNIKRRKDLFAEIRFLEKLYDRMIDSVYESEESIRELKELTNSLEKLLDLKAKVLEDVGGSD